MRHHLYRHLDADGRLLYVGITTDVERRLMGHRSRSVWFEDIASVEVCASFDTRDEAAAAERDAIQKERPLHNIKCHPNPSIATRFRPTVCVACCMTPSMHLAVKLMARARGMTMQELLMRYITDGLRADGEQIAVD